MKRLQKQLLAQEQLARDVREQILLSKREKNPSKGFFFMKRLKLNIKSIESFRSKILNLELLLRTLNEQEIQRDTVNVMTEVNEALKSARECGASVSADDVEALRSELEDVMLDQREAEEELEDFNRTAARITFGVMSDEEVTEVECKLLKEFEQEEREKQLQDVNDDSDESSVATNFNFPEVPTHPFPLPRSVSSVSEPPETQQSQEREKQTATPMAV